MKPKQVANWLYKAALLFVFLFNLPGIVKADDFSPALLQLTELPGGWVEVTWKKPVKRNSSTLPISPVLPDFLTRVGNPLVRKSPTAWIEHSTYRSSLASLAGSVIGVDGLEAVSNDVLVRVQLTDGTQYSTVLRAGQRSYTIPERPSKFQVAVDYWLMGTIHILEGVDHLLFVFALLLIVMGVKPLITAVTAFTVAHSISLGLATLNIISIPSAPTESIIALSIVFLAAEIVRMRKGELGITGRWPWFIAFVFGLFHGLGFAGALSEIGLPQHEIPLALLTFNVGVETGQLLFIAVVLGFLAIIRRLRLQVPSAIGQLVPYAIGCVAAFWTIERAMSFLPHNL